MNQSGAGNPRPPPWGAAAAGPPPGVFSAGIRGRLALSGPVLLLLPSKARPPRGLPPPATPPPPRRAPSPSPPPRHPRINSTHPFASVVASIEPPPPPPPSSPPGPPGGPGGGKKHNPLDKKPSGSPAPPALHLPLSFAGRLWFPWWRVLGPPRSSPPPWPGGAGRARPGRPPGPPPSPPPRPPVRPPPVSPYPGEPVPSSPPPAPPALALPSFSPPGEGPPFLPARGPCGLLAGVPLLKPPRGGAVVAGCSLGGLGRAPGARVWGFLVFPPPPVSGGRGREARRWARWPPRGALGGGGAQPPPPPPGAPGGWPPPPPRRGRFPGAGPPPPPARAEDTGRPPGGPPRPPPGRPAWVPVYPLSSPPPPPWPRGRGLPFPPLPFPFWFFLAFPVALSPVAPFPPPPPSPPFFWRETGGPLGAERGPLPISTQGGIRATAAPVAITRGSFFDADSRLAWSP